MPILDVEFVLQEGHTVPEKLAGQLADAAGDIFKSPPGTTWVRLRPIPVSCYAENGVSEPEGRNAVFVSVLKALATSGDDLEREIGALTNAVAEACGRKPENVHILYQPPAAGRIAFGGRLRT